MKMGFVGEGSEMGLGGVLKEPHPGSQLEGCKAPAIDLKICQEGQKPNSFSKLLL